MARAKGSGRPVTAQPVHRPAAAREEPRRSWLDGPPPRLVGYAGDRIGLPETGRGSVATQGQKLVAFVLDVILAGVLTLLALGPHTPHQFTISNLVSDGVYVVLTTGALALSGRTLGMRVLGLQVVRRDGHRMGWRSLPRQVLTALLVPAVIIDRDRRGLHDKLLGTVVVRVA